MSDAGPDAFDGTRQHLHVRARLRWAVTPSLVFAAAGVAGVIGGLVVDNPTLAVVSAVGAVAGVVFSVVWARLEWARWSWSVHPDALELAHGVVSRETSLVPFHRIQQIDLHRGPVERALGLSTLVLRTAAATSDAHLPGIDASQADGLRHRLLARAGIDDAV